MVEESKPICTACGGEGRWIEVDGFRMIEHRCPRLRLVRVEWR